jgi:pimeloyl-ACP methyl ester carboxylesterase
MPLRCTLALSACALLIPFAAATLASQGDIFDRVTHGHATSEGGVKIHYASLGKGPLVVMIHGFPDFWYSWRHQMEALSSGYQVVAIDQRGYNLSDKPKGGEHYDMRLLVADVAAVIRHLGRERATVVGHDWGGVVAWQVAMHLPQMVDNLSGWVTDPVARKRYVEAFKQSDFDAMLQYYKRNYPRESGPSASASPELPKVTMPVLMFHGLNDQALHADGLSGTWKWLEKDLTLVTVPQAGHFVQQDAADLVTKTMQWWLAMRTGR